MQSDEKIFLLRYQGKNRPRKLAVDQNINKIIAIAKELFDISVNAQCYLAFNGQEISEDAILGNLNPGDKAVLELIQRTPFSIDPFAFQIYHDPDWFDCQGYLFRPIREALEMFYQSKGLTSAYFEIFCDGNPISENALLQEIPDIKSSVIELIPKIKDTNQVMKKEEEKDEKKKPTNEQIPNSEIQSKEKKVYTLKYQEKVFLKQFSIDADVSSVSQTIRKTLKFADDIPLILKFKQETMDFNKCLNDYILSPREEIQVEIFQDQNEKTKILLIHQNKKLELHVNKEALIQTIKGMACLELKIQPSFLYSLSLDHEILSPSAQLQSIAEFGEDSVFELLAKIKVYLMLNQKDVGHLTFDPNLKVEELKKQVQAKKLVSYEEFNLKLADIQLKESNPLSFYLKNEDPVVVTISEIDNKETKIQLLFNKLPENKGYQIAVVRNESFQDLVEVVGKQFDISGSDQVWKYKEEYIVEQSTWEDFKAKHNGEKDLVFDIFECSRPFIRTLHVIIHSLDSVTPKPLELNILMPITKLKAEVAQQLQLSETCSQTWKIEQEELQDELPLAVYEDSIKRKNFHIHILDQKSSKHLKSLMPESNQRIFIEEQKLDPVEADMINSEEIEVCDAQSIETITEAAYQFRNKKNSTDVEKEAFFEAAWQKYMAKFENLYNREKESENLFQTVVENYKANLHQIGDSLPFSQFPRRDNSSFQENQQTLQRMLEQIYQKEMRFEFTRQSPALIFRGGKGNISFKYLDLRPYFERLDENIGIHRSKIFNLFDLEKIREHSSQSLAFQDQEKIVKEEILRELSKELDQCGLWIDSEILKSYLKYEQNFSFMKMHLDPFEKQDLNSSTFAIRALIQNPPLLKFVDSFKIEINKKGLGISVTHKSFIKDVLKHRINWKEIKSIVSNQVKEVSKTVRNSSLVAKIEADFAKIHLKFQGLSDYISVLCDSDEKSLREIMSQNVLVNQGSLNESSQKDISSLSFNFLKKDVIQKHLQKVEGNSPDYLIIQRLKGEKWIVKKEFEHISWLVSYAKEELAKISYSTMEYKPLEFFITQKFKFSELVRDIFEICATKIQSINNYNSIQLYQQIVRETNDLIGVANNDLQQVSYRLDFKLVGEIHLQVVHLIWRYFEERHWEKITQPLEDMKNQKEQQKRFFKLVASSDDRQINKAEAEKISNCVEEFTKSLVQVKKEEIIKSSIEKFKKQTKRRDIQDQLDSKYFSRNAVVDNDDLYFYILNPQEVVLKAYEATSDRFCQDLENQIQDQSKYMNNLLGEFMARIIKVQSVLNCYDKDFWALHNKFEFKKVQVLSKDEVLAKKYQYKISQVYYQIILAFLQGNVQNIFKEYEITPELKVVLKKIESIQISQLENKNVLNLIKNLESQPGNTTNARLFIENLLKEIETLKNASAKFLHFSLEDLKGFKNKINVFVCKQKCPCCDRICGEEDPIHKTHRCLYGHQIRAIGGTMRETREASVARCEDLSDLDNMEYNGRVMTWAEFKEERKSDPNNPWSFDDIHNTKNDDFSKEKFELAWILIGKRICEVKYKDSEMKFVPFNKATIDAQKVKFAKPSNYIFMIDSSASMSGDRWIDVKKSLKETLGKISDVNKNNKVSIVNFSSDTQISYENAPANSISVDVLNFLGQGTDFSKAFASGFELMKKVKQENIVFIFMTDGEAEYPTKEINDIKGYLNSLEFANLKIKFSFNGIGFKFKAQPDPVNNIFLKSPGCNQAPPENVLERLVKDLGGNLYLADTGADLTKAYIEILNKKDN